MDEPLPDKTPRSHGGHGSAPPTPAGDAQAAPGSPPPAPEAGNGQRGAPSGQRAPWLNAIDGPLIATETQPVRLCPKCNIPVPLDAISCTRCGRWAPESVVKRKRLKKSDVEKILVEVKAKYQPDSISQHDCEALALALAERKVARPGSTEFQRLNGDVASLRASLESSRPPERTRTDAPSTPDDLKRSALKLLELARLLKNAEAMSRHRCGPDDQDGGPLLDGEELAAKGAALFLDDDQRADGHPVSAEMPTTPKGVEPMLVRAPEPRCE